MMVSMPRCGCHGKPASIIFRNVIAKIVQKEKRIEVGSVAEAERAAQMHARAIARRFGSNQALHRTDRHKNQLPTGGSLLHCARACQCSDEVQTWNENSLGDHLSRKGALRMAFSCRKNFNRSGMVRAHHFALGTLAGSETPPARVGVILAIGNVALKSRF